MRAKSPVAVSLVLIRAVPQSPGVASASHVLFDSLTNLKKLDISSNDLDSDSLVGMGKLVLLEKLDLSSCHLNKLPFSFDSLTNLKELDISRNKLDSDSLVDMEKLVLLEKLNLSYCFLKKFQIRFASLTSLRELNISWNKLRSDLLVGMEKLVSLEKLSLSFCDLKKLPFKLSSLTKLRNLDLCDNPLDPDTLDEIVKLESLEYLDLSRCQLIKLPSSFEMLKNLKQLLLLGNNFEEYPSALKSLPSLHTCIYVTFFDLLKKHPTGALPTSKAAEKRKLALFRHVVGEYVRQVNSQLEFRTDPDENGLIHEIEEVTAGRKLNDVLKKFQDYCNPWSGTKVNRFQFHGCTQSGESCNAYLMRLKRLAEG
ncbi:uncharacterized protein [Watersipora subatra]|uniref:uncharacterized protein n=1 Tax=Watersipora subatra TaxID=2589382 RepID=UPI00355B91EA